MVGGMVLLVILAVVIGGTALWAKQARLQSRTAPETTPTGDAASKRISLLTEAIGYIGTILLLAGASAAVGQRWADMSTAVQVSILGLATLIFLGIGWFIRASAEPAFQRLTSVIWVVSLAAFAGCAAVVTQSFDMSEQSQGLTIVTATTLYAAVLWSLHHHALQHAVLFFGVLMSTVSIILWMVAEPDAWMIAVPLWAIGAAWAAAGWWRRIAPWFVAVPLGLLVALVAPATIDQPSALRFGLGIGTAATVMTLSVLAKFTPGLAMASVGMLGYVIGAVIYYFGDTLGVPASLTIAGLLILSSAAAATRWHWFSRTQPPGPPPTSTGDDTAGARVEEHHTV